MNKIRRTISDVYRMVIFSVFAFATWKIVRYWRAGSAEKAGHAIDASIHAVAEKLEKTANVSEKEASKGLRENLGKGLGEVLSDTKMALGKATVLVNHALKHAK